MAKDKSNQDDVVEAVDVERRRALSRLGLVATAAYVTPALMTLSQSARASDGSGGGSGGGRGGGSGGNSGGSGPSGSSGPSRPTRASGPSELSGPSVS